MRRYDIVIVQGRYQAAGWGYQPLLLREAVNGRVEARRRADAYCQLLRTDSERLHLPYDPQHEGRQIQRSIERWGCGQPTARR
jgi:hypothetical protein